MGSHFLLDSLYPDTHSEQEVEDEHFLQPELHLLQVKVLVKKNSDKHVEQFFDDVQASQLLEHDEHASEDTKYPELQVLQLKLLEQLLQFGEHTILHFPFTSVKPGLHSSQFVSDIQDLHEGSQMLQTAGDSKKKPIEQTLQFSVLVQVSQFDGHIISHFPLDSTYPSWHPVQTLADVQELHVGSHATQDPAVDT